MNGGAALGMVCVLVVVAIPIGLLVGAGILMGAVALANMCLPQPRGRYDEYDEDEYDEDDDWDRPTRRRNRAGDKAIPPPKLGWAVVIVIVNAAIGFVVGMVLGFVVAAAGVAANPAAGLLIQGVNLVLSFFINAGVLTAMLPTTFPRACLVTLFQLLIGFVIALIIFVPLVLLGIGLGGFR